MIGGRDDDGADGTFIRAGTPDTVASILAAVPRAGKGVLSDAPMVASGRRVVMMLRLDVESCDIVMRNAVANVTRR